MDARPLLLHVIFRLDIGGLENGLVNLINATGTRFRHAVVCLTTATAFAKRIKSPDVRIYELHKRPGNDLRAYWRLWKCIRQLRPDVVHTRNFGTLDCQLIAAFAGVPVRIHGEHGWDVDDLSGGSRKRRFLRRVSRLFVHRYVAVSAHIHRWLVEDIGLPARIVRTIINGVDTDRFSPRSNGSPDRGVLPDALRERDIVFAYVGRMEPVKAPDLLIEAFISVAAEASRAGARPALALVGSGSLLERISARLKEAGLDGCVWLAGPRNDIDALMRAMDVFVLPSLNEGISNTVLEAMASGLPVIAARVGGNPELIADGKSGQLVTAGQAGEFARAMRMYLDDPSLARSHGREARHRAVERFSLRTMMGEYVSLYDESLRACGRGA